MKNFLIDTHILIWFYEGDTELSYTAKSLIENPTHQVFISIASFYEIAIKLKLGKLQMSINFEQLYSQTTNANITVLPITDKHLNHYLNLPIHPQHKDPFDRLIIATAIAHNCTLISADKNFELYKEWIEVVS